MALFFYSTFQLSIASEGGAESPLMMIHSAANAGQPNSEDKQRNGSSLSI